MSLTRFSHVTLVCADLDVSLDFYRGVLEMDVAGRPMPAGFPRAAIGSFANGDWCLHFFQATPEQAVRLAGLAAPRTGPVMHVSLRAEGYVATRRRLEARGLAVREFTVDRHLVQFLDPDGVEIELAYDPEELPDGPIPWTPQ